MKERFHPVLMLLLLGGLAVNSAALAASTTTNNLAATPSNGWYSGTSVLFTAIITPTPTDGGIIDFYDGTTLLGGIPTTNGQALYASAQLALGLHSISASYLGTSGFLPSASGTLSQIVGNMYYVATNGSDTANTGKATNQAWQTLQHAETMTKPGDIVYMMAGYHTNLSKAIMVTNSGTAQGWITYSAYPGEEQQAIICGSTGQTNGWGIIVSNSSYIAVTGLALLDLTNYGILFVGPGSNYLVAGNYTSNTFSSGVGIWGAWTGTNSQTYGFKESSQVLVSNNTIVQACNGGWNEELDIVNGVDSFEVCYNVIRDAASYTNGGEGIDCKDGISNGKVHDNTLYHLKRSAIYLEAGMSLRSIYPIPTLTTNLQCYNNTVYDNGTPVGISVNGIQVTSEGDGDTDGVYVYNNVVYGNGGSGIVVNHYQNATNYARNIFVLNNTIYNNGLFDEWHGGLWISDTNASNVVARNNVTVSNVNLQFYDICPVTTFDHNLTNVNPLFANAVTNNYRLQGASPARGAGSTNLAPTFDKDGNPRSFSSGIIDLGAYEYTLPGQPLLSLQLPAGQTLPGLELQGLVGCHYSLQWCDALAGSNAWNVLQDISPLSNAAVQICDPAPVPTVNQRFYRAVGLPY